MSAYASGKFKQDMPPPGGYAEIYYKRIPAQRIIGFKSMFIASCLMTAYGYYYYCRRHKFLRQLRVDERDHLIAIQPLAMAEQDRAFLRQLRHNRHVERDLMKNVPDWKVGTLWGLPVYKNTPENELPSVAIREYYAHRNASNVKHVVRPNTDVGLEKPFHRTQY